MHRSPRNDGYVFPLNACVVAPVVVYALLLNIGWSLVHQIIRAYCDSSPATRLFCVKSETTVFQQVVALASRLLTVGALSTVLVLYYLMCYCVIRCYSVQWTVTESMSL